MNDEIIFLREGLPLGRSAADYCGYGSLVVIILKPIYNFIGRCRAYLMRWLHLLKTFWGPLKIFYILYFRLYAGALLRYAIFFLFFCCHIQHVNKLELFENMQSLFE